MRVTVLTPAGARDVAVDGDLPLGDLVGHLHDGPVAACLDGRRPLDLGGPGLAAQGVLDGSVITLVAP